VVENDGEATGLDSSLEIERAWELLNTDINRLVDNMADRLDMQPEKIRQLSVVLLYHQLELQRNGQVFIVTPAANTFLYKNPLEVLAAQDTTGLFAQIVEEVQGDTK
jgi:hypothetical protein